MTTAADQAQRDLFRNYRRRHYLGWFTDRIPLSSFGRGVLVALMAYAIFLIMAALSNWTVVIGSSLHLLQINFSITLGLGVWFGDIAIRELKPWLEYAKTSLNVNQDEYAEFVTSSLGRLGTPWIHLYSLLFLVPGIVFALIIGSQIPNALFPVHGDSPVFIYVTLIEFGIMLHLFGGTGIFSAYWFTKVAEQLSHLQSVDYSRVDQDTLGYLAGMILKVFVDLFIIVASIMPSLAYVGMQFAGTKTWTGLFGIFLPTTALAFVYIFPTYYLHCMLVKAKNLRLLRLKNLKKICEETMAERVLSIPTRLEGSQMEALKSLLELIRHFQEEIERTERLPAWPFSALSIARLAGSSLLPLGTLFAQNLLAIIFK